MTNPKNISKIKEPKKEADIEWNNKNITAYTDLGLEVPDNVNMFERRFLAQADITKGPIEKTVMHMVRLRAPDYLGQEKNKTKVAERREFLYYSSRWTGFSWRGVPLNPVEHIEGYYNKQFLKPHYSQQDGGIDYEELDIGNHQTIYYIPWSKKTVDEIISKSAHSDKDNGIVFTIKFASEDCPWGQRAPTRNQFNYEQFSNWKWEDIYKLHVKPQEVLARELQNKDKSAYNLQFEPT